MNPELAESLREDPLRAAVANFNVTIIYECLETGKHAKRVSDQVIADAAVERAAKLNLWNFSVLGIPEIRNAAASAAAEADLVILSMSGRTPLPAHTVAWIEMWTWLINDHKPAVIALFTDHHSSSGGIEAYLQRSVLRKKLDFFQLTPGAGSDLAASGEPLARELKPRSGLSDNRRGDGKTALIVDDYVAIHDCIVPCLSGLGYRVLTAVDGKEAQEIIIEQGVKKIDLLITDLEMPRMRGDELSHWFHQQNPEAAVLVIAAGCDGTKFCPDSGYLQKPFSLKALVTRIDDSMDGRFENLPVSSKSEERTLHSSRE